MRTRLTTLAVVIAMSLAGALALAADGASASNGGVYVVTPTWWGWCPGSSVTAVYWWNDTTGASGGDAGDDIVWVSVNMNQPNTLTLAVKCRATWESAPAYTTIRPTRTGQAWFVGADSNNWHN